MSDKAHATVIHHDSAPRFGLPGLAVTGLASPSRGARETSVWKISVEPGAPGVTHSVTREEIFVCISGQADVRIGSSTHRIGPGDALIVPRDTEFALSNPHEACFEAVVALPVGAVAITSEGSLTPPWAK